MFTDPTKIPAVRIELGSTTCTLLSFNIATTLLLVIGNSGSLQKSVSATGTPCIYITPSLMVLPKLGLDGTTNAVDLPINDSCRFNSSTTYPRKTESIFLYNKLG